MGACGGSPAAGPSPLAEAPPTATVAGATALPSVFEPWAIAALGLDPDYVRALVYVVRNDDGSELVHALEAWGGGPIVLCGDGVDAATIGQVLAELRAAASLPATIASDRCNVRYATVEGGGHPATMRTFSGTRILDARILCPRRLSAAEAVHELGHVLGLGHSLDARDVMYATPRVDRFSARERAVLARMY